MTWTRPAPGSKVRPKTRGGVVSMTRGPGNNGASRLLGLPAASVAEDVIVYEPSASGTEARLQLPAPSATASPSWIGPAWSGRWPKIRTVAFGSDVPLKTGLWMLVIRSTAEMPLSLAGLRAPWIGKNRGPTATRLLVEAALPPTSETLTVTVYAPSST